jgi:hypothetical protein
MIHPLAKSFILSVGEGKRQSEDHCGEALAVDRAFSPKKFKSDGGKQKLLEFERYLDEVYIA